jgi:hypothetical protein
MGGTSLLMQEQIDDLRAERDQLKADLHNSHRAHLLLDDVLTLRSERACSGDIQEAIHRLWLLLDQPADTGGSSG